MTQERNDSPTARTSAGAVSGRREDGLDVFRGIRFAEPPVGDLRFAAPRQASPWTGVRDAARFGPPPPQDVGSFRDRLPPDYDPLAGERDRPGDWLTVNVWTPSASPASSRPVVVWVYGGAYKVGSADTPGYDAQRIARDGDVVVVTFNYRVGIEGFAVIDGAPANRGLLDQVAALEWVRGNIAAFGGDPDRVTVAGESAGAGCIAALLAMPRADGLFKRAIVASMPGTFLSRELGAAVGAAIAAERGLRSVVADLAAVPRMNWSWPGSRWPAICMSLRSSGGSSRRMTPCSPGRRRRCAADDALGGAAARVGAGGGRGRRPRAR